MKGTTLILKHNIQDTFIKGVSIDILNLWGGNMDLQMVIDDVAAVMYVCSYMMKGEKVMGETLKRVVKECRDDDIQTQMKKIKKEFLGKSIWMSGVCHENIVNVVDEEKQESCDS